MRNQAPSAAFLRQCAFLCMDIQEESRPADFNSGALPKLWKDLGFSLEDVNAGLASAWEVCRPNAVRAVTAARAAGMNMVFIHWGYLFEDGMDLDPLIYQSMLESYGHDFARWTGHIARPDSQPAACLGVRPGEYVLPKSGQDAFTASNLEFVLRNLDVKNLVFIGGHTEACLGKTARTARERGFRTLCLEDATNNARESTRRKGIEEAQFDYVISTQEFTTLCQLPHA